MKPGNRPQLYAEMVPIPAEPIGSGR